MLKADNEHIQKQEYESSVYEFFVSFPALADDANCSEEIRLFAFEGVGVVGGVGRVVAG